MSPTSHSIVIAGGSGFIGHNLCLYLTAKGYRVTILARQLPPFLLPPGVDIEIWNGRTISRWAKCLEGALALINLTGRSVDCVKTPDHCDEILRSRVEPTRVLGLALKETSNPPQVWIQMSTAHIYGDPPNEICHESSSFGYGLAPLVGQAWEEAHISSLPKGMRSVILRTSFVIGKSGGALSRLSKLTRCGLGGTIAHGQQGMSWIHEEDMSRIVLQAVTNENMHGAYIASSPNPVSNQEFMRELRRVLRVPIGLPASAWMVRIGAPLLLKTDPELALYGRYCIPQRLLQEGFKFRYPHLQDALINIYT